MILVNDHWEQVNTLQNVSKIIRENYNRELADELDKLIPEHTNEEYEELEWKYDQKCDKIADLENKINELEDEILSLEIEVEELEGE